MRLGILLKDERLWIAVAMFTVVSLILVWCFWHSIELMRALSLVHIEQGKVSVDGVEISNPSLATRNREVHGRWKFWAKDNEDPTDVATAYCGWNTYDDERDSLIPFFSIRKLYRQAVATVTRKVGRQPEVYRWEDDETWDRLSAIWQLDSQYIELTAGHNNDNDSVSIRIFPGRLDWEAVSKHGRQTRFNRRPVSEQDVADFLATFRGR